MKEPLLPTSETNKKVLEPPPSLFGNWRTSILWIPIVVCITVLIIVDILEINSFTEYSFRPIASATGHTSSPTNKTKGTEKFTINQEGCKIPYLDAFDPNILKFIFKPKFVNCSQGNPNIIQKQDNELYINTTGYKKVECNYQSFWRRMPNEGEKDTQYSKSRYVTTLENDVYNEISDEFISVQCKVNKKKYKYFYSFIPKLKVKPKLKLNYQIKKGDYLSVLVIGVDAVSRLNLHRQMPLTYNYFVNEMGAKEMLGYNKIGDNTYPNLMVVLNGLTDDEIDQGCLKKNKRFDTCPLVWEKFRKKGYITGFAEDATHMGLFTYHRDGFYNSTLDYDYRIFDQVAEEKIGHNKKMNSELCFGNDLRIQKLVDYIKEFSISFRKDPYFFFTWGVSMSHDYLNDAKLDDKIYYELLKELNEGGALKNTAVFFMSDHGIRWGDIRRTYQGFLEERLPFLIVSMPKWFQQKYPSAWANLITNMNRLTTPYDLHETFVDLTNLTTLNQLELKQKQYSTTNIPGISLFLPMPKKRTCAAAAVPNHYCTCQNFKPINITSDVVEIANFVVDSMNRMLIGYRECAKLELKQVHKASRGLTTIDPKEKLSHVAPEFTVTLTTVPGEGLFEASVKKRLDGSYVLTGTISRINLYGSQSRCISDFNLKLYCYCQ